MNIEDAKFLEFLSSSISKYQMWEKVLKLSNARNIVEIGIWEGDFTKEMLVRCGVIERYYMIDPWAKLPDWNKPCNFVPKKFDDIYDTAMENTVFAAEKCVDRT